jgi:hypothetical protein
MTEPITTTSVAGLAAAFGGITMSLLGVPYLAVVWGFVGALVTMMQMATMPKPRAFVFGLLSTLAGAALGTFGVEVLGAQGRAALVLGSLVGGAGAFALIAALVRRATVFAGGQKIGGITGATAPAPLAKTEGGKP